MIPVLAFVQHYKKFYTSQFESAAVRHGLNQLEIDILLFLHNNPDCRTASDICRYRGLAKSNVSKAVEHLRTMGMLTVSPAADNRRQRMLGFTDAAAPLVQELHAIQQAATAAVTADLTPAEAYRYMDENQFAKGSMLPKVEAAVEFAESAPGRSALITLLEKAKDGVAGKTGTAIHQ